MKRRTQTMNAHGFNRLHCFASGLAIALAALLAPSATASSFSADLSVSAAVVLPPGINPGQAAAANPACETLTEGSASAFCQLPTSNLVIGNGFSSLGYTAGPATGSASLPFGYAFAKSSGSSITESFTNTTSSPVTLQIGLTYTPNLAVSAGKGETSLAYFALLFFYGNKFAGDEFDLPCNACGQKTYNPGVQLISVLLNVPANGAADIVIEAEAAGDAAAPEPATLLVLVPGLLGVGYGLRRQLCA